MSDEPNFLAFFRDSAIPMHEIEEGLFLGSLEGARNRELLRSNGITYVLSFLDNFRYFEKQAGLEYHQIEISDSPGADILKHVPESVSFISNSLKNGRVLVHCAAGVSRSASIVIAYIMIKYNYTFDVAKAFVKSKRGCVWPNGGFQRQIATINPAEYQQYLN